MINGLLAGFRQLGMETGSFPHRSWLKLGPEEGLEAFAADLQDSRPDVLVFAGYSPDYFASATDLCRSAGTSFVYWATEDPVGFDRTLFLALRADYVFTTTVECIPRYAAHGVRANLLLFAANPEYHHAGNYRPQLDLDLALAASFYRWPARMQGYNVILDAARESGRVFRVWGAGWDSEQGLQRLGGAGSYRGYLPNRMLPDLCASARIILGVQCDDSSVTQTSMRPYEVLGCRGFHLTQWTPATARLFADGTHLVTARTKDEAAEKIAYYLSHESERKRIAAQGQELVYREHTYLGRIKDVVMPALGLPQA